MVAFVMLCRQTFTKHYFEMNVKFMLLYIFKIFKGNFKFELHYHLNNAMLRKCYSKGYSQGRAGIFESELLSIDDFRMKF